VVLTDGWVAVALSCWKALDESAQALLDYMINVSNTYAEAYAKRIRQDEIMAATRDVARGT
jgi:hypothetical protein